MRPAIVYHATRTTSVPSIKDQGLCPGTRESCNAKRLDSLGSIYAVAKLGAPGDASRDEFGTAYWWLEHLSQQNRFGDLDWSILQIDVAKAGNVRCLRDIWSHTGIEIRTDVPIAWRFLKRVA
jgi:hypothetical protein